MLIILLLLALCSTLHAANSYDVKWVYHVSQKPERVRIDLSLDSGDTWKNLGLGLPSRVGTNTFSYSLPDITENLSDHAVIRVMEMRWFGRLNTIVTKQIHIAGIKFIDAPDFVTNGVPVTLSWVAAGAGEFVQLSYLSITNPEWQAAAVFASSDSDQGAVTNSVVWNVEGLPVVPTMLLLKSMERPTCHRTIVTEIVDE